MSHLERATGKTGDRVMIQAMTNVGLAQSNDSIQSLGESNAQ